MCGFLFLKMASTSTIAGSCLVSVIYILLLDLLFIYQVEFAKIISFLSIDLLTWLVSRLAMSEKAWFTARK
jgi:hypothetical protein